MSRVTRRNDAIDVYELSDTLKLEVRVWDADLSYTLRGEGVQVSMGPMEAAALCAALAFIHNFKKVEL